MNRIFLLAVALALASCGSHSKRAAPLLDDVRGYHDGVRWAYFAQAAVRLPGPERDAFIEEREDLADDLRIADYEITRVRYAAGKMAADVDVKYTWHLDSRGIVHTTTAREKWERRGKRWVLLEEERRRGEPMPGLAEPSDESDQAGEPDGEAIDGAATTSRRGDALPR